MTSTNPPAPESNTLEENLHQLLIPLGDKTKSWKRGRKYFHKSSDAEINFKNRFPHLFDFVFGDRPSHAFAQSDQDGTFNQILVA
jgi:hypothetical protein